MSGPSHPKLSYLYRIWLGSLGDPQAARLPGLMARDLAFFKGLLKDSLVARGPAQGPFRLSFVGTDLESHLGLKLLDASLADCFAAGQGRRLEEAVQRALAEGGAVLAKVWLSSAPQTDRFAGELLCLPEREMAGSAADEVTVFGALAVEGFDSLSPDPAFRRIDIAEISLIRERPADAKQRDGGGADVEP